MCPHGSFPSAHHANAKDCETRKDNKGAKHHQHFDESDTTSSQRTAEYVLPGGE